ncbi:MAG TPA: hypothetical protein VGO93_06255 [Candidatus Xenobia bacterium]
MLDFRRSLAGLMLVSWGLAGAPALARPRVRSVTIDDHGTARVHLSQPQIFDEIGGKGRLNAAVDKGLAVLDTDLTLPEEASGVSGNGFLGLTSDSLQLIGNFLYVPVKSKQIKLDVDYRSVETETTANGRHTIKVDYPLALEHVPAVTRAVLAQTTYDVTGHATWSKYSEGNGNFTLQIREPSLKKTPSPLHAMTLTIWDKDQVTNFKFHFDLASDSALAQVLQKPSDELQAGMDQLMSALAWNKRAFSVTNVKKHGKSLEADVFLSLEDFRKDIIDLLRRGMDYWTAQQPQTKPHGFTTNDFLGALSRTMDLEFKRVDINLQQKSDRFDIQIQGGVRNLDKSILGYLSLMEVVQPALVEAGTKQRGLAALDKQINTIQTNRFRQNLIAAGESEDTGRMDYTLKVAFPKGRLKLQDDFKFSSVIKTYNKASEMMHVPVMHQAYSQLVIKSTPAGVNGHYFSEAQGPWFASQWQLYQEAAKDNADFKTLVPDDDPQVQDGKMAFEFKKRHVKVEGFLHIDNLGAVVGQMVSKTWPGFTATVAALSGSYDADKSPGHILWDLFLQGKSADEVKKDIARMAGNRAKTTKGAVTLPTVSEPKVDMAAALQKQVLKDRATLGVTPWVAPPPVAATPTPGAPSRPWAKIFGGLLALLLLGGGAAVLLVRRRPPPPIDF